MTNLTPLLLGLAGGIALWRFAPGGRPAPRNAESAPCQIQLDANGLAVDGDIVDIDEAVRLAQTVGFAFVTVASEAPASTYAALSSALRSAGVSAHVSTPIARARNGTAETFSAFTLVTYPEGIGGARRDTRWFRTDAPMTWRAVRDQLAAAKVIDPDAISPTQAGYWKLVTDPRVFLTRQAKPLPVATGGERRDAARAPRFALEGGRVIARDDQPLVRLERVDLGDGRYALSPHETDALGARVVRLLNRRGAR